ncbi:MAG: hypothetical protein HDQ88_06895 [Clostridia bacterium]|nr:hypothetical protein [Clostridia bacterium]
MSIWSKIRGYVVVGYYSDTDNDEEILMGMQESISKVTPLYNSEIDLQIGLMQIKHASHGEQWHDKGHRQFMISFIANQRYEDVDSLKPKIEKWLGELTEFAYISEVNITITDDYGVEGTFTKNRFTYTRVEMENYEEEDDEEEEEEQ